MKKLLLLLMLLLVPATWAQITSQQVIQWQPQQSVGLPPFGTVYQYLNGLTGQIVCINSTGASVCGSGGGGAGTVVSVTGTANQINSTGGTAPVLSLANPLTTPGPVNITGGVLTTDVQPLKVNATYNNAAVNFNGSEFVTVDTAHATTSYLLQVLGGVAGTTPELQLDTSGNSVIPGTDTATAQIANGAGAGLLVCTQGVSNIGIIGANSAGFMCPTSIATSYAILMPTAGATAPGVFTLGTTAANVSQGGFSSTPVLGTDNSVAGSVQVANGSSNAHTIWASAATTSNTINGFAVQPSSGDLVDVTVPSSNVATLHDSGVLTANLVTSSGTLTSTALVTGAGSKGTQTPCATCTLSSGGAISLVAGGSLGSADTGSPTLTFSANKVSFNVQLAISGASNQLVTGTSSNLTTTTFPAPSGAVTVTMPNTTTSVVSAAATLTSTAIMTGGGTATSQTPSATSTLTSGGNMTLAGTLTVNGECGSGTAGCLVLPQGSAQGHATANAIVKEAPAAVTAYENIEPGTSATGFRYGTNSSAVRTESFTELSGDATTSGSGAVTVAKINGVAQFAPAMTTSAMSGQTSASCTNVTNMTWNIAANKNYILKCEIPMTLAASATIQYCIGGPGTATSYSLIADGDLGTAGIWSQISTLAQTAYGTKTGASAAVAANTVQHVWAGIQNGATASGTALTLQTAANGTNAITVGANATCQLTQIN